MTIELNSIDLELIIKALDNNKTPYQMHIRDLNRYEKLNDKQQESLIRLINKVKQLDSLIERLKV